MTRKHLLGVLVALALACVPFAVRGEQITFVKASGGGGGGSAFTGELPADGSFSFTGRSKISSMSDGRLLFTNNAGTDFVRLAFGGTTSAFPALKRLGNSMQLVLADESSLTSLVVFAVIVGPGGAAISSGLGTPEGVYAAPVGSMFLRTDGGATTTLYVKTSGGATSTGWTAK